MTLILPNWKHMVSKWEALKLVFDYLPNRKQRVKINEAFSSRKVVKYDVPQGSILGPLLFDIHLCDLFYFLEDLSIASYADIYRKRKEIVCYKYIRDIINVTL